MKISIFDVMQWLILWLQKKSHLKIKKKCQMEVKLESSPNGEQSKRIHTDKELAKMAGVGTGTIARYDAIMKTDVLTYLNQTFVNVELAILIL